MVEWDISCHPWKTTEIDILFYGHHSGEPCFTQISILKRYNNFICAIWQRWKLFVRSTPKLWNVTAARFEFGIQLNLFDIITLKINQFIFIKHFEKTSPCDDKIYKFNCMFRNCFRIFWKGCTRQCMVMKNTRARNDVQCPFIHQSCKTWPHWAYRKGAVCMHSEPPWFHEFILLKEIIHFFLIISHFTLSRL